MSEARHTPGDWIPGRPDMATIVDGASSKWIYAGDKYVAVASGRDIEDWDEVMANARIIAASPDLYEACEAARRFGSQGTTDDGRSVDQMLRAAIAKATQPPRGEPAESE